jgi:hypothetical protein
MTGRERYHTRSGMYVEGLRLTTCLVYCPLTPSQPIGFLDNKDVKKLLYVLQVYNNIYECVLCLEYSSTLY